MRRACIAIGLSCWALGIAGVVYGLAARDWPTAGVSLVGGFWMGHTFGSLAAGVDR